MNTFNNFSPLAFREKIMKATYKKWYAYGKEFALPFSTTELPPFQFTVANLPSFDPTTVEVFLVDEATGTRGATGIKIKVDSMDGNGSVLYVSPGSNVYAKSIEPGVYRAEFAIPEGETYVSTPICVTDGIETNTNFVKLEYWNDEKLAYPNGFVTTGTDNDFKFQMYIPTTFFKPKYEFEEEITKRAGYKFLELQTCNKVFGFNFLAPEYICDALRLVRLSDYIRFTHDGEYYNALNFEYNPDWQDNGYLAAIECQFETDTIIQKLPSFNRRDRESFYNALLADIETPILFSPDTVGLYYREFKQGEPTIKGKLIRELSPIDLIDENTTIAVDMGAGEARKFNLYRMLEGYISKNHEDVTEFLLSLRGGVNIGTPNTSGEYPASVDRDGNVKLQNIQGGDAVLGNVDGGKSRFDSVETGFFTVNSTAATIDAMGNTDVNELTARGDSLLRGDVYTGFKNGGATGKITKEGQLQYLSAIIYEFLSSETFVPGFLGEGFKIWLENGNWHIECDNLTVRQTMNIFELLIQKIRSVNGAIVVSQSNGKLSAVEEVGTQYKLTTGEEFPTFQEGDLVRCQTFAGYQGAGLTFDFTQFAKFDYSGSSFDSSLVDVTPDSISFNLNDTANSGFAFYKMHQSSAAPIEIPSFTLILEGAYPGMMAIAAGLDSNDSPVESAGVLLQNGENVIPAITAAHGIHNFAITVVGDSGHGTGKVTVKQKRAAGSAPNNSLVKFYWVEVKSVDGTSFFVDKSEFNGVVPAVGDEVVQMGNTKNAERQALIYITAQESGKPYIEILNGVKTKSLTGTDRTRLGDLSNIVDPDFTGEAAVKGTGFYSTNAFLKGIFVLRNGKRVEDEIKIAKDAADQAAQDASNAAQSAQEAKNRLNKWADDGFISPTEKTALIDEGKRIQAEYLQIKANADKYGVLVTEYTEAYNNYLNELRYHSAATPEDIAVRPELAQSQTAYYDKRNGALNAIADAAKSYVDNADKKLKEYLDTEITAIPGKIELAVRSLKIADVNLLKGAYKELGRADYGFGSYLYDVPVVNGKEYMLTVCYTLTNDTYIEAYSNQGSNFIANFITKGDKVVESKKVTMVGYKPGEGLWFFQFPNGTYGSKVHWAVLTDGNLGVTSWIPAASEKNVGLKNLCSFKRITDAGFTYASRYDDDGTILMLPSVLHKESTVANKDMFGLTYDSQKRYYVFIDHFVPSTTIPNGTRSISLRIVYTDGTSEAMSVLNDSIENNFILTSKAIRYILGSYDTSISTYLRIGIFETNFPVSWSPAPEDQLYQSVKYTDTQILAVDGKISLSVTTELNKRVIGGANLILKSGTCVSGVNRVVYFDMSQYLRDLRGKKITISFDYEYSNLELGSNNRIGLEEPVLKDGTSEYYWVGTFKYFNSLSPKAEKGRFVNTITIPEDIVNSQNKGISVIIQVGNGTNMKVCNPQIEIGDTATGWSPAPEDGVNQSIEYTKSQIDIVEGKIESKVEKTVYQSGLSRAEEIARYVSTGKMLPEHSDVTFTTGLNNLKVYNNAGNDSVELFLYQGGLDVPNETHKIVVIKCKGAGTPGAGGFYFGNTSRGGAVFLYKITASIPNGKTIQFATNATGDGSVTEWLTDRDGIGTWKDYYCLRKCGSSGTFSSTGFFYIEQQGTFEWYLAYATCYDIYGDNSQITKTDYQTKITQLDQSISLKASQTDLTATTERVRLAEIKLDSTSIKLGVVEGTANSANTAAGNAQNTANAANSLASTANIKAEAADGRVTATQNGLVATGIDISSRKIVLKSDNVLFQNNAGQQTAAINANGRLTANVIEAGEVVANGFAAQRITTGNLTVTDGAEIAGMTISGNRLTGGNINLTSGARIGSFQVSLNWLTGLNSAQMDLWSGTSTGEGNNTLIQPGRIMINQKGDNDTALEIQGKGNTLIAGKYCSLNVDTFQVTANQVRIPGVFYACTIMSNGTIASTWGSFNFHITRVRKNGTGRYIVEYSGYKGLVFPMVVPYDISKWTSAVVEIAGGDNFAYKTWDVSGILVDCGAIIYFCGMPS